MKYSLNTYYVWMLLSLLFFSFQCEIIAQNPQVRPISPQQIKPPAKEQLAREYYKNKDYEKAGSLMALDVIHQPYRKNLLPYWDAVVAEAKSAGVWGTALSGAGPTMISMCSLKGMKKLVDILRLSVAKLYKLNIIGCEIDQQGIKCI